MKPVSPSATSGSTLLLVLIMLFILSGLCTISITNGLSLQKIAESQVEMEEAYLAAEAGVQVAAARINLGQGFPHTYTQANGNTVTIRATGGGSEWVVGTSSTVGDVTETITVPRMFRPSHFGYGLYVEDFDGTWLPGDEVDGRIWTGTAQTIFGYSDGFGSDLGPVFADVNQIGADAFLGSPQYASTLDPDTDILSYSAADKRFWDTYTDGYDIEVTMPSLSGIDFASARADAVASTDLPAGINPDTVDLATAPTNQVLLITVPSPPYLLAPPPVDYTASGRNFPSTYDTSAPLNERRSRVELRFNIENNNFSEESGVLHIAYGTAADFAGGTQTTLKVYTTSLRMIYFAKDYVPPTLRDKWDDFEVVVIENTANTADNRTNIVRGNFTIWSEDQITIQAGIEYDDETRDTFGMVGGDDIEIQYNIPGTAGDGVPDIELHGGYMSADVYSTLARFQFMDYNNGTRRGELRLFGNITTERLYPLGVYTTNVFTSGYILQMEHDDRLITNPPPYSPVISDKFQYEQYY